MKKEFNVISELISQNSRVLDVGCGDGELMKFLKDNKTTKIRGLEISLILHHHIRHLKL
jgi:cyclopropane fatty-acyl-phospholipid synthase-like methyltransferase